MEWLLLGLGLALIVGALRWFFGGPSDPDDTTPMRFGGGGGRGRR
jgi:hypothetical protein